MDASWSMTAVDDEAFAVAFSAEERRIAQQGRIRHAGGFWTCPEIVAHHHAAVLVRVPTYEGWSRLPVFSEDGQLLGFAERETGYGFLDQASERLKWLRQQLPEAIASRSRAAA
jgi:hypothetical protein